jgi:DNA-directed RNA polymerase specialized sigma24 family protein
MGGEPGLKLIDRKTEYEALHEFIRLVDVGGSAGDRVRRVVNEELTERQRLMVEMYYAQGISMPDIALELGVCPSSVSRTIMRGKGRIRKYLKYNGRAFAQSIPN